MATLVSLRDQGMRLPAGRTCVSALGGHGNGGASMDGNAESDPLVKRDVVTGMATAYLAGQDPRTPLASPLHADLKGLPPLLIQVGSAETLLDDARRLADRARAAGVDVTYEAWPDMVHVWHWFGSFLPEAQQAIQRSATSTQRTADPAQPRGARSRGGTRWSRVAASAGAVDGGPA